MTAPRRGEPRRRGRPAPRPARPARAAPGRRAAAAGPPRPPELDPARQAALELLTAVRVRDAYANLALPAILRRYRLHDRDAALATELGYGTLRAQRPARRGDRGVHRPAAEPRSSPPLLDALRLGAYQLLRTRVPAHAAVDTTVELVRVEAGSRSAGFVNAVLRRVGEHDEQAWVAQLAPAADGGPGRARRVRARPPALDRAGLRRRPGRAPPRAGRGAGRRRRPPDRAPAGPARRDHRRRAGAGHRRHRGARTRPTACTSKPGSGDDRRAGRGPPRAWPSCRTRAASWWRSRWPAPRSTATDGGRWLDLCAGPGGKAALLGGLAALDGGRRWTPSSRPSTAPSWCAGPSTACRSPCTSPTAATPRCPTGAYDRVLVDAPVHRAGRAAPAAGGALAPPPRGRVGAGEAAARAADRGAAARPPRRRGGLRDLLAAPGRDRRGRSAGCCASTRDVRAARRPRAAARGARRSAPARPCSCGRTGTAPTRCSWRCCAAPAERLAADPGARGRPDGAARNLAPCTR